MKQNDILVKWTGSKRLQVSQIISHFPENIDTYYEPFIGGASVLYETLSHNLAKKYRCSDLNAPLVGIWNLVKNNPESLFDDYSQRWLTLKKEGKEYYYNVRREFNEDQNPFKFFFLLRTCRNGLVRYNKKGEFNSGFHLRRNGIIPKNLKPILDRWHSKFSQVDITFENKDYRDVKTTEKDFLYLDPPYMLPKARRTVMYYGDFDFEALWEWLKEQRSSFALSLNGFKNDIDCTIKVPEIYDEHFLIHNGLNKFDQMSSGKRVVARDSLYVRGNVS